MLDLFLANSLMKARCFADTARVAPEAHLLLVGDTDQLPSVGPGAVLHDLITSGLIPVVRLTQVFRQAQESAIITNAHRINQGEYPRLEAISKTPRSDCLWFNVEEPEQGVQAIRDIMTHLIPSQGFDPAREVQVLCPMTRGDVGTRMLESSVAAVDQSPCW